MKKSTKVKYEKLEDCLHVIGCKCPIAPLGRSYWACSLCILIAKTYRFTEVLTRPIPNPEGMIEEELVWFETVVENATKRQKE